MAGGCSCLIHKAAQPINLSGFTTEPIHTTGRSVNFDSLNVYLRGSLFDESFYVRENKFSVTLTCWIAAALFSFTHCDTTRINSSCVRGSLFDESFYVRENKFSVTLTCWMNQFKLSVSLSESATSMLNSYCYYYSCHIGKIITRAVITSSCNVWSYESGFVFATFHLQQLSTLRSYNSSEGLIGLA